MIKHKQLGMTLIEIIIALAILSIIAAIAIPSYTGYISTSRNVEGWNNLSALKLAEEEYFLENNKYFAGTDAATLKSNSDQLWEAKPNDDNTTNFDYSVTLSGGGYVAKAKGKAGSKVDPSVELIVTKQ